MSNYPIGFPQKEFQGKGQVFYETLATIQLNTKKTSNLSSHQLRKSMPLAIYRKEIHNIKSQQFPKTAIPYFYKNSRYYGCAWKYHSFKNTKKLFKWFSRDYSITILQHHLLKWCM
jgi:hypothetical protein